MIKFKQRQDGSMMNEVFVDPAKVVQKIPVVDSLDNDGDQDNEKHILPVSPEKQKAKKKQKSKIKHQKKVNPAVKTVKNVKHESDAKTKIKRKKSHKHRVEP